MAISITTCGRPGAVVTGSERLAWSYKTEAAATTASTSLEMADAAKGAALLEAKIRCSCDAPGCREKFASLGTPFTTTSSVERSFWGLIISLLGGKGWKAVVSFSYTVNVWCEQSTGGV